MDLQFILADKITGLSCIYLLLDMELNLSHSKTIRLDYHCIHSRKTSNQQRMQCCQGICCDAPTSLHHASFLSHRDG